MDDQLTDTAEHHGDADTGWGSSSRETWQLTPNRGSTTGVRVLLESDGLTTEEIIPRLPYDAARSRNPSAALTPDARRLRGPRQITEMLGMAYQQNDVHHVTAFGATVRRWWPHITERNWPVLGRHAAWALAACQLRNPLGRRAPAHERDSVRPFVYIWRAMLALDGKLSSDELNRAILRTGNPDDLATAIDRIARRRSDGGPVEELGPETVSDAKKNDRIISWVSLAGFGWTFIQKKDTAGYYTFRAGAASLLTGPAKTGATPREFTSKIDYVQHISEAASLPKDVR